MSEVQEHRPEVEKAQSVGQGILRDLEGKEHEKMNARLKGLTSKYTDLDDMLAHRLDELEQGREKAADFEGRESSIGVWLGEKEKVLEDWEVLPVDSAALEQRMERIGVSRQRCVCVCLLLLIIVKHTLYVLLHTNFPFKCFPQDLDQQVTDYLPTVVDLFRAEEALLGSDLETISAFESCASEGPAGVRFAGVRGDKDHMPGEQGRGEECKRWAVCPLPYTIVSSSLPSPSPLLISYTNRLHAETWGPRGGGRSR